MTDFSGFKESFMKSNSDLLENSEGPTSNSASASPGVNNHNVNIPSIKIKPDEQLASKSLDIKKQLSQSFHGSGGSHLGGGISKPQSRRNSAFQAKSNNGSDDEDQDDDKDEQGNERKRRDNINEKIQELLTLIPSSFFQDSAAPPVVSHLNDNEAEMAAAIKNSGTKDGKPNKGQILTKSVEYLQYLQNLIDENNRQEVELIMKLKNLELKKQNKLNNVPINIGNTSAERSLGKIGVGPLSDEYFKEVLLSTSNKSQRRGSIA